MLLVVHAATGALIAQHVPNAAWAFVLAFIAHFIMDFIPHGDHEVVAKFKKNKQTMAMYFYLISDWISTLIFVLAFLATDAATANPAILWGILGGVIPDVLVLFFYLSNGNILHNFTYRHHQIHNFFPERKNTTVSFRSAMIVQALFMIYFLQIAF